MPLFTDVPIEIRERVYADLLTYFPTPSSNAAPSSPICALLTLNRQIHAEIITFLQSQLLVLLRTNDEKFIEQTLDTTWGSTTTPVVSQLRSRDGAIKKSCSNAPIAIELEFYMYMSDREPDSYGAFLIPVSSLKSMVDVQGSPSFYIWTMQSSLSIKIIDTFAHTAEEVVKLFLRPYVEGFLLPVFVGIKTEGLDLESTKLLRETLKGDYEAEGLIQKLRSLQNGAMGEGVTWERAAGCFQMAKKYAEMLWENHEGCLTDPSKEFDGIHHLWMMHSTVCGNLVQVLLNIATGTPVPVVPTGDAKEPNELFVQARNAAENAIRYLNPVPEWGRPETSKQELALRALRKNKAKISFRAHGACKGMGDVNAAVGYLKEAMRHEPETRKLLLERIEELKQEGAQDNEGLEGIVKWE
jgi:hypothetical protein